MTCNRILLVDDEEAFVKTLGKRLTARGLEVETVGSGEEAVEMAQPEPWKRASLMMPSSTVRRMVISSPQRGLCPSALRLASSRSP